MSKQIQRNSKKGYMQVSTQSHDGEPDTPAIANDTNADFFHLTLVNMCLLIEYLTVAAIGSKVLFVWFRDNIDDFNIKVASQSDYTYNECNVDSINHVIDDKIKIHATLYVIWCIIRLFYIICAMYACHKHQFEHQWCNKLLLMLHVVNIVFIVAFQICSTVVGSLPVKHVTNGALQEGPDVRIGFYGTDDTIGIALAIDYTFFAVFIGYVHLNKTLLSFSFGWCIGYCFVLFGCWTWMSTAWGINSGDTKHPFVSEDIRFVSINAVIQPNIHEYQLLINESLQFNMSMMLAADENFYDGNVLDVVTSGCKLFEEEGKNDVGATKYGVRFIDVADSKDVIKYGNVHGNINHYDGDGDGYPFQELYMYCDYMEQTNSLAQCSIGAIENKQKDTIITIILIYFKECNTLLFDAQNMTRQFESIPTNEPHAYLRLTVCYDEFVHPQDSPFQWP